MLVLTRKLNQSIMLGDDIKITLLEIKGDQVRIGVEAPNEVRILRTEVYETIQKENQAAADSVKNLPDGF